MGIWTASCLSWRLICLVTLPKPKKLMPLLPNTGAMKPPPALHWTVTAGCSKSVFYMHSLLQLNTGHWRTWLVQLTPCAKCCKVSAGLLAGVQEVRLLCIHFCLYPTLGLTAEVVHAGKPRSARHMTCTSY